MPKGSCICGAVKVEFTGEPMGKVLCHCEPCKKYAGANGSTNLALKTDQYHQIGDAPLRHYTRKGASGADVTYDFCAVCPTVMTVRTAAMNDVVFFKLGLLDSLEEMERITPNTEIFVKYRIAPWCERGSHVELKEGSG
ncbi:Mss4-like protein [Xylariaceae sp. FL0255]|nr:Mss4-like protein [Xylariaceae sp. FL0255]